MRHTMKGAAVGMMAACLLGGSASAALAGEGQQMQVPPGEEAPPVEQTPPVEETPEETPPAEETPEEIFPVEESITVVEEEESITVEQCTINQTPVAVGLNPDEFPVLALGLNLLNDYYCTGNTVEVYD